MSNRILVDEELFLGRVEEQQRFRVLLEEVLNIANRGILLRRSSINPEWSYVVLLYGAGGMGKTTLSKRLRDIAHGLPPDRYYQKKFKVIWLDWEIQRQQDHRLAARSAVNFETILDHLYNAFCKNGFSQEFNFFAQRRTLLRDLETHIDKMLNSHDEGPNNLPSSLIKLGSTGLTNLVREKLPTITSFLPQDEMAGAVEDILRSGNEEFSRLRVQANEWLRHHFKTDEYNLLTFPQENLSQAFAQGVRNSTNSKPLIIFLDTYEIVDKVDQWLRLVISQSGMRAVWILSGRDNLVESRRYGQNYFIGYQGEAPTERLRTFPMSEFSQGDIITYFNEKVPTRSLTVEQATMVHHGTYGIPLAVKTVAALWSRGATLEAIIEGIPERADRETIVKAMTDRLLVHARADATHPRDVLRLYALGLVYQPDYELLTALWKVEDVRQVLDDLEYRYDFVFAYKMRLHDVMRDFLREYLLADVERKNSNVQEINKRAVALLEQRLTSSHNSLQTLEARLGDDHWTTNILALIWHRLWFNEDDGWKTLQITFLMSLAYDREFARTLLNLASFFSPILSKSQKQRLQALEVFLKADFTSKDELILLNILEQALSGEDIQPDQGCITELTAIVFWLRGLTSLQQGRWGEALQFWIEASKQTSEKMQKLRTKIGLEFRRLGDVLGHELKHYDEASIALEQAVNLNPKSSSHWHSLGHMYEYQDRLEEAINVFEQASKLNPKQPENWKCLGSLYRKQGRLDQSIKSYLAALEKTNEEKRRAVLLSYIGSIYNEQGKIQEALNIYKEISVLDPLTDFAWKWLGRLYVKRGQFEEAVNAFNEAYKISSNDEQKFYYLCELGKVNFLQEHLEEAASIYNQARLMSPNSGKPYHALGHIFEKQNQSMNAIAAFQQAISLEPERFDNLRCLVNAYIEQGQFDQAINTFLKFIKYVKSTKHQSHIWSELSHLYCQQDKIDEAINAAQQSTIIEPTEASYWFYLGSLWQKKDNREEANNAYTKGLELVPQNEIDNDNSLVQVRQFLEEGSN